MQIHLFSSFNGSVKPSMKGAREYVAHPSVLKRVDEYQQSLPSMFTLSIFSSPITEYENLRNNRLWL